MNPSPPVARPPRRNGAVVASVIALTIGLSGFFMGLRQTSTEASLAREVRRTVPRPTVPASKEPGEAEVPVAMSYARLKEHTLQPNHAWANHLADLDRHAPTVTDFAALSRDEQAIVRHHRAARRQYDGAPPVAPHPLNQSTAAACLECHGQPVVISGITVPQMSHQPYENCLQCHVSAVGPTSTWRSRPISPADGNAFVGKPSPGFGRRAYEGAPPVVPHATWMRQNCLSCHGPGGANSFRTPHPDRHSCLQCHAPDASIDQSPSLLANNRPPPLLPAR